MSYIQREFIKNKRVLNFEWNSMEIGAAPLPPSKKKNVRNMYSTTIPDVFSLFGQLFRSVWNLNVSGMLVINENVRCCINILVYKANSSILMHLNGCLQKSPKRHTCTVYIYVIYVSSEVINSFVLESCPFYFPRVSRKI